MEPHAVSTLGTVAGNVLYSHFFFEMRARLRRMNSHLSSMSSLIFAPSEPPVVLDRPVSTTVA
jgi:hypothetical protein